MWNHLDWLIKLQFFMSIGISFSHQTLRPRLAPVIEYYYWNVDPFYHVRKILPPHGILHESFKRANIFCNNIQQRKSCVDINGTSLEYRRKYIEFIKVGIGHKKFHDIVFKPNRLDLVKRPNYTRSCDKPVLQIWGVIYMGKSKEWIDAHLKDLTTFQLTVSKFVAVIMRRESIDLLNKVGLGVANCFEIVLLSILFAFIYGIVLWIFERNKNPNVSKDFLQGSQETTWCTFVSMAAIGYGDSYPVTLVGKSLILTWITVGLVMISTMVGIVFGAITRTPDFRGKTLAVIPNTMAEKFANDSLHGTIIHGLINREIFQYVIDHKADAAIINSDVYAEYQTMFRNDSKAIPLHVVKEFRVDQPIFISFDNYNNMSKEAKELFTCLTKTYKELIFDIPVLQYSIQLRVDGIHYTNLNKLTLYMVIAIISLLFICLLYAYWIGTLWSCSQIKLWKTMCKCIRERIASVKT